jgi:hypothetical protein
VTYRLATQPNLTDLEYWATGSTAVYLEGALERTLAGPTRLLTGSGGDAGVRWTGARMGTGIG